MTDTDQGAAAPNDAALFSEATSITLEDFENPKPEPTDKPVDKPVDQPVDKPADKQVEEPAVPPGVHRELREELRRAQRERDDLAARMAQLARPQQQTDQKKPDVFEDPQGFVMSILGPELEKRDQKEQLRVENLSMRLAQREFGPEVVTQSRQALEHFMGRNDPGAWATYNRAMQSDDPYGVIAGWYHERSLLHEIGGDPNAYVDRKITERMKDPEFRKKYDELLRSEAQANGNVAFRPPVTSAVPKMPSLGNVGASGGDTQAVEPSDAEYFRAATTAKRR